MIFVLFWRKFTLSWSENERCDMLFRRVTATPTPADAQSAPITMRDGTVLAADVYRPDHARPTATILIRTPYNKAMGSPMWDLPSIARLFVAHGFSVVAQDVRGKFASEGATASYRHEIDDGFDTLEWIIQQDWADGNVGMWGLSYFGFTQLAALASGHPALRCLAPRLAGSELGFPMEQFDGCRDIEHAVHRWYFAQVYAERDMIMSPINMKVRPLKKMHDTFFEALGHRSEDFDASFDPSFPERVIPRERLLANPKPILFNVGTYDSCGIWSWRDIEAMQKNPKWNDALHLRIESIDHEGHSIDMVPMTDDDDHRKNEAARERLNRRMIDPTIPFFNKYLRGIGEGVAKVTYQVGGREWRTGSSWPPQPAQTLQFYLTGDGQASGLLSLVPTRASVVRWEHDPEDPVPSVSVTEDVPCGPGSRSVFIAWPDLAPVGNRKDVLEFRSEPLTAELILAGPVSLRCMLGSTLSSADIFVRLIDLGPDGRGSLICRGHVRVPIQPVDSDSIDEVVRTRSRPVTVPLLHASYVLWPGHRLLVHVFSSDYPEYLFNPGNGVDTWDAEEVFAGTHMLEIGGQRGAALLVTAAGEAAAIAEAFA